MSIRERLETLSRGELVGLIVVVAETGCAELETYVGIIVTAMARAGDFQPTREAKARWFASELNFNLQ